MRNPPTRLIVLIVLQVIAVSLYPPAFFARAPQAALLPPVLLLLLFFALVGMNVGVLNPISGRTALILVQGLNIVVRLIMFFPNLKVAGSWDVLLALAQLVGMGLSWFNMMQLEQLSQTELLLRADKVQ